MKDINKIYKGLWPKGTEMGDRFYAQQKVHKPKRRLKADVIKELDEVLGQHIDGLDRLTIKTLDDLIALLKSQKIDMSVDWGKPI